MTKLTERLIQNRLWSAWGRVTGTLMVPNYTPAGWYECDLFYVTAAGFMREYEIKISVADFRADFGKGGEDVRLLPGRGFQKVGHNKHQRLEADDPHGPRQFWYVVPEGLITAADVPDHAGLMYVSTKRYRPSVVRDAPVLHSEKVRQSVLIHARGVCYYRMWNERMRNSKCLDMPNQPK